MKPFWNQDLKINFEWWVNKEAKKLEFKKLLIVNRLKPDVLTGTVCSEIEIAIIAWFNSLVRKTF